MKKLFISLILTGMVLMGIVFLLRTPDMPRNLGDTSDQIENASNQVIMQNLEFKTRRLIVKKGTTVSWKNLDDAMHNIAFDSGPRAGTEGEFFGQGTTYSVMFDEVGVYNYHCRPHPYMKAVIEVIE